MHELFEELQAFRPHWQTQFATLQDASRAAGCEVLFLDWCRGRGAHTAGCRTCKDTLAAQALLLAQAGSDSLPYSLDTIGAALDRATESYNTDLAELL